MTTPTVILGVERPCAVDGCARPARKGRRRCSACDHAIGRYGDPHHRQTRTGNGKGQRLLAELLAIETDDCILWPLHTRKGYGYVRRDGRNIGVHVIACEARNGPAPTPQHEVAHSCTQTRACLNYRHLRWATRAENIADKVEQGTDNRGERCPAAKLTADDVRAIRRRYAEGGITLLALGVEYGVAEITVLDCIRRRTWAWLDPEGNP